MSTPDFYLAEVTAYRPGASHGPSTYPWASSAWASPPQIPFVSEVTEVFRASDSGYRTEYADGDVLVYQPVLERTVDLDRQIPLSPASSTASASTGIIRLINASGRWDDVSTSFSSDARPVELKRGVRTWDALRGLYLDPPSSSLATLFRGMAQGWRIDETALEVPIKDASYWLEQPYQRTTYAGTGGYEGDASLAGQTKPRARGGTATMPIRQCTPVLLDAVNRIYQYSDAPGQVVQVYERGAIGFGYAGDTTNLYAGSTPSGSYRTDNSRALLQLGAAAQGAITVEVIGEFPTAGAVSQPKYAAAFIMSDDAGLDPSFIDSVYFDGLDGGLHSGWYWPSGDRSTCAEAVSVFLRGMGVKLIPTRSGKLRPIPLRTLPSYAGPVATLTAAHITDLAPVVLPSPLDPPAYRWRVGYACNHTVQTSGLSELLPDDQRRGLGQQWPISTWLSADALAAYSRPSDPDIIETALLDPTDAANLAADLGALWSLRRRLYSVTVPISVGIELEIGDVVQITYQFGDLRTGKLGQIVGDQLRGQEGTIALQVLV